MNPEQVAEAIARECDAVKELLLSKNRKYGNSALDPVRIFSRAQAEEQIKVRIDDKLSRLARGVGIAEDEDTEQDLIGYLILLRVARKARTDPLPPALATTFDEPLAQEGFFTPMNPSW